MSAKKRALKTTYYKTPDCPPKLKAHRHKIDEIIYDEDPERGWCVYLQPGWINILTGNRVITGNSTHADCLEAIQTWVEPLD